MWLHQNLSVRMVVRSIHPWLSSWVAKGCWSHVCKREPFWCQIQKWEVSAGAHTSKIKTKNKSCYLIKGRRRENQKKKKKKHLQPWLRRRERRRCRHPYQAGDNLLNEISISQRTVGAAQVSGRSQKQTLTLYMQTESRCNKVRQKPLPT